MFVMCHIISLRTRNKKVADDIFQLILINHLYRANGGDVRMEFVSDALGRYPGFEVEVTQVPCLRDGDDDLPTLFYPGDSYGAPSSPVVTSRSVLLDTRVLHSYRDSYLK